MKKYNAAQDNQRQGNSMTLNSEQSVLAKATGTGLLAATTFLYGTVLGGGFDAQAQAQEQEDSHKGRSPTALASELSSEINALGTSLDSLGIAKQALKVQIQGLRDDFTRQQNFSPLALATYNFIRAEAENLDSVKSQGYDFIQRQKSTLDGLRHHYTSGIRDTASSPSLIDELSQVYVDTLIKTNLGIDTLKLRFRELLGTKASLDTLTNILGDNSLTRKDYDSKLAERLPSDLNVMAAVNDSMSKATGDEALITSIRTFNEKSRKNRGKLQREFNDYEEANKEGFLDTTPGKLTLTGIGAGLAVLVGILWPKGKQSVPEPNGDGDDTTGGSGSGDPFVRQR